MNATIRNRRCLAWCAAILILMPAGGLAATRDMKDVDLDSLIRETARLSTKHNEVTLLWWVPEEFWSASLAQDPAASVTATDEAFLRSIRAYTMIIVHDGTLDAFGKPTFRSEQAIRGDIHIVDRWGHMYAPLTAGETDVITRDLTQFMQTHLADFSGPVGRHTYILLFPSKTESGARIVEATKQDQLKVILGNREFRWRLPLDSLLVDKVCSGCGEECKGSWDYCPWCGAKLGQP